MFRPPQLAPIRNIVCQDDNNWVQIRSLSSLSSLASAEGCEGILSRGASVSVVNFQPNGAPRCIEVFSLASVIHVNRPVDNPVGNAEVTQSYTLIQFSSASSLAFQSSHHKIVLSFSFSWCMVSFSWITSLPLIALDCSSRNQCLVTTVNFRNCFFYQWNSQLFSIRLKKL